MFKYFLLTVSILALSAVAFAANEAAQTGPIDSSMVYIPAGNNDKGTEIIPFNDGDSTLAPGNGFCWQYGGVLSWPDFSGSFAVGFMAGDASLSYPILVESFKLGLTTLSGHTATINLFIVGDNGGVPDDSDILWNEAVSCSGWTIPTWPSFGYTDIDVNPDLSVSEDWYCGWHPEWPGAAGQFYIAIDNTHTYEGRDWTYIAAGIGYPTGWNNTGVVWGGANNEYITCTVDPDTTAIADTSLGSIKAGFAQ
jgi:hypothetical protein